MLDPFGFNLYTFYSSLLQFLLDPLSIFFLFVITWIATNLPSSQPCSQPAPSAAMILFRWFLLIPNDQYATFFIIVLYCLFLSPWWITRKQLNSWRWNWQNSLGNLVDANWIFFQISMITGHWIRGLILLVLFSTIVILVGRLISIRPVF